MLQVQELWVQLVSKMKKTMVIGIDGIGRDSMERLLSQKNLPNLSRIRSKGCLKTLESTIPPVSAPAWVSYQTGVKPEEHGVYGFYLSDGDIYMGGDVMAPRFWSGEDKVLVNIPLTYPPQEKVTVSGLISPVQVKPTSSEYRGMSKPSSVGEILENLDYIVTPGEVKTELDMYLDVAEKRTVLFENLLARYNPNFASIVYGGYDRLTHTPDIVGQMGLLDTFIENLDSMIGRFLKSWDGRVMIISDHGEQLVDRDFFIEELLNRNGYLRWKEENDSLVADRENSDVIFYAEEHSEYGKLKLKSGVSEAEVRTLLLEQDLVEEVYGSEEIYGSDPRGDCPDLVFKLGNAVPRKGNDGDIVRNNRRIQHAMDGIIMADWEIKKDDLHIWDVASLVRDG